MKIGVFDGSISFAFGTIEKSGDRTDFLRSPLGGAAKEQVVNPVEDWRHITVRPEPGVAATLIYQGERLHQVFVAMTMPSDDSNEWTADSELERKAKHDAWLQAELGKPPYDYSWGRIVSEFDAKGCASEIIVSYAK